MPPDMPFTEMVFVDYTITVEEFQLLESLLREHGTPQALALLAKLRQRSKRYLTNQPDPVEDHDHAV
jgi:hypothetical protein